MNIMRFDTREQVLEEINRTQSNCIFVVRNSVELEEFIVDAPHKAFGLPGPSPYEFFQKGIFVSKGFKRVILIGWNEQDLEVLERSHLLNDPCIIQCSEEELMEFKSRRMLRYIPY